jgi:hypothetical protein
MNIFEQATKLALRFPSTKGDLTTEQLWDLPLQAKDNFDLDSVAKAINKRLKDISDESFVSTKVSAAQTIAELKLEVVKHVIAVRLEEADDNRKRAARVAEKNKLLGILGDKQDEALKTLTPEEIKKRIAELEA